MLTEEHLRKLEELKKRYPTAQALVLPVLWMAQEQFGWISEETMKQTAELLGLPYAHVLGVVSFYTMFHTRKMGKHHIEICTNVSCMLRGSARILEHLQQRLGIKPGETSPDGKWSLEGVECLGACGGAPMLAVGEEFYENLTPEKVDQLLKKLS